MQFYLGTLKYIGVAQLNQFLFKDGLLFILQFTQVVFIYLFSVAQSQGSWVVYHKS